MHSPRDLRRRIRAITSTAQITRAMQMVASSTMRRAQEATVTLRPFMRLVYRMQREATTRMGDFSHPLLEVREVRRRAIILIGANRGLCGALNSNLFRVAAQFDSASTAFIAVGRKAAQFIARSGRQLVAEFPFTDRLQFADARAIAAIACDLFLQKQVDQVQVVVTRFINTLTQQPVCIEFLPVAEIKALGAEAAKFEAELAADATESLFEPSPEAILGYMLSHYLNIYIFQAMLNAKASEQSARMVSMKNATDNAEDLIRDLTLEYNKLRQGNITKELLEIAGGQSE